MEFLTLRLLWCPRLQCPPLQSRCSQKHFAFSTCFCILVPTFYRLVTKFIPPPPGPPHTQRNACSTQPIACLLSFEKLETCIGAFCLLFLDLSRTRGYFVKCNTHFTRPNCSNTSNVNKLQQPSCLLSPSMTVAGVICNQCAVTELSSCVLTYLQPPVPTPSAPAYPTVQPQPKPNVPSPPIDQKKVSNSTLLMHIG